MDGRRGAWALGLFTLGMVGCAGAGHRAASGGFGPLTSGGPPAHSAADPFAPPSRVGLARYFPNLQRPTPTSALADHAPGVPGPDPSRGWERPHADEAPAPRPGLLALLRGRLRPSADAPDPSAGQIPPGVRLGPPDGRVVPDDPLAARGSARPAPGPEAEPARDREIAPVAHVPNGQIPDILPVAIVAEVDPESLPSTPSERARARMIAAAASRDGQAQRVRAELADVPPAPEATPPEEFANPFEGLVDAPAASSATPPATSSATPPEALADPFADLAAAPSAPSVAPATAAEPLPPNPFEGLIQTTPPPPADLFADRGTTAAPNVDRPRPPRSGGSSVPLSRRYAAPPIPAQADPDLNGRPRLPLDRPWRDSVSAELPPPSFPPSYAAAEPEPHPHARTPDPRLATPEPERRPRLFRRWRERSELDAPGDARRPR